MEYTDRSSRYSAGTTVAALREGMTVTSVLDVGCARGTWLDEWRKAGVEDVFGVDGDYASSGLLHIPRIRFLAADLAQPFDLGRRFDLVQSLEVAEHVAPSSANVFVENLVRHSNGFVLFSAAPPGQGGEFHVNEQPYDYWREKFGHHGYVAFDCVRPLLAGDRAVSFWYRFNTLLYATSEGAERLAKGVRMTRVPDNSIIGDVSPFWFKFRKRMVLSLPFALQQSLARLKARTRASR